MWLFTLVLGVCSDLRVDPPFWWAGMKQTDLQIMVYGDNIGNCGRVTVSGSAGAKHLQTVRLENTNYISIHVDISSAKPGIITITFGDNKNARTANVELKERTERNSLGTFGSGDIVYLLMPDRFSRGNPKWEPVEMKYPYKMDRGDPNARHGGDLLGIKNHLNYFVELGVTCLWLTPVLENDIDGGSYHGYTISDYYRVDPRFGTNEEYVELVKRAQELGLKVVMDMVFNHCSSTHMFYQDKPTRDWFHNPDNFVRSNYDCMLAFSPYASEHDKIEFQDGAFDQTMPDLNQRNKELAKYLIQNSIWWIEYANLNGIRMDTFPYCDQTMMKNWIDEITNEYGEFNVVGECWADTPSGCAFFQKGNPLNPVKQSLQAVMDFPLMMGIRDYCNNNDMQNMYHHLSQDFVYPDVYKLLRFLENHDTDRFFKWDSNDLSAWKMATVILATIPGIPQWYYATEIGMSGEKSQSDGYVRKDFPGGWDGDPNNCFTREGRSDLQNEAFDFCKNLFNWRKNNLVIAHGTMKQFRPQNGVFVYARELGEYDIIVIINGNSGDSKINLDVYAEVINGRNTWTDVLTGNSVWLDREYVLHNREILVLEPADQQKKRQRPKFTQI